MPVTDMPPLVSRVSGSRAMRLVRIVRLVMMLVPPLLEPETIYRLPNILKKQGNGNCTAWLATSHRQKENLFETVGVGGQRSCQYSRKAWVAVLS